MHAKKYLSMSLIMISVLLLSACNAFGPQAAPTLDPAAIQVTLEAAATSAMQTISVQLTGTALAQPTNTPTNTVEPTATFTATASPTPTIPPPTATNTRIPATNTPTYTPTPADYGCTVTSVSPASGTKLNVSDDFDLKWVIKNTGTKNWDVGTLDLKYDSGQKFQKYADIYDVNTLVEVGKEITLIVDAVMPGTAGTYTATWKLLGAYGLVCNLPVNLVAVQP